MSSHLSCLSSAVLSFVILVVACLPVGGLCVHFACNLDSCCKVTGVSLLVGQSSSGSEDGETEK